jgi:hypothetical protein
MSNLSLKIIAFFSGILLFMSCQKPQEFPLKSDNNVLFITMAYKADPSKDYYPVSSDLTTGEIQFKIPPVANASFSQMQVRITIPASAIIQPAFVGTMDLSKPYRFSVIAEDGQEKKYLLVVYN